ncbi:MAG: trigger factor [Bacteroidales bacterium]|nr:trigger factor [Bacteroidales bacterium]MBN2632039.1 trigger factor [Bacteroidales bacterium]
MNITRENIDDLNAVLTVKIEKADFGDKVENTLKDYRRKANIKGFRPGMVPIGLIKKMYGTAVKVDEINKIVSDNIHKYITDEKIEILGDPLPRQDDQEKIDFETQDDFSFSFELGLAPAFEVGLNKKTKVDQYEIIIDEKMRAGFVENYTRRHGEFTNADISEEKDILKGHIAKLDNQGNVTEEGPSNDHASISIDVVKDEELKKELLGKKENDHVDFDLKKGFPNDTEVAGLLNIKKEEAEKTEGRFRFTINEISRFRPAAVDQELFNHIYGEGVVSSEEEFMQKIEEEISASLSRETEYKLLQDLKKLAVENTDISLPEAFLKKWLLRVNENTTEELIEKEFDTFRHDLKWQLIRNRIAKDNEIRISEEELQKEAENITRYQFSQYGLYYVTDEQVANYARETLKKEDDAKRIADKILEDKVLKQLKEMVNPKTKKVTADEFNKLFE